MSFNYYLNFHGLRCGDLTPGRLISLSIDVWGCDAIRGRMIFARGMRVQVNSMSLGRLAARSLNWSRLGH